MKLYLDNCSYNRPFDDQTQMKIHLETEAKLYIQECIREGRYGLVWSYMLDYENNANPYDDKKRTIEPWKNIASEFCTSSEDILLMGKDIMQKGIKAKDALHIACAIKSECDYFITTDMKLLNKSVENINIINPIDFIREVEGLR